MRYGNLGAYSFSLQETLTACSRLYRFNGHSNITVLEHMVHAARLAVDDGLPNMAVLAVLTHDLHEAYIGDIVTPVLHYCDPNGDFASSLALLKTRLDEEMCKQFGWPLHLHANCQKEIKYYDQLSLWMEAHSRFTSAPPPAVDWAIKWLDLYDEVKFAKVPTPGT